MSKVRIVCKAPPAPPPDPKWPHINGVLPSLCDTTVFLVDDDGTERELEGVTAIHWSVRGSNVARAVIEVAGVEIDAEAVLER